jgi:hypothetical protein
MFLKNMLLQRTPVISHQRQHRQLLLIRMALDQSRHLLVEGHSSPAQALSFYHQRPKTVMILLPGGK